MCLTDTPPPPPGPPVFTPGCGWDRLPVDCFLPGAALLILLSCVANIFPDHPHIDSGCCRNGLGGFIFFFLTQTQLSDVQPVTPTSNSPQNDFLIRLLILVAAEPLDWTVRSFSCHQVPFARIRYQTSIYWWSDATACMPGLLKPLNVYLSCFLRWVADLVIIWDSATRSHSTQPGLFLDQTERTELFIGNIINNRIANENC